MFNNPIVPVTGNTTYMGVNPGGMGGIYPPPGFGKGGMVNAFIPPGNE